MSKSISSEAAARVEAALVCENQALKLENEQLRALLREIREDWFYKPLPDASVPSFEALLSRMDAALKELESQESIPPEQWELPICKTPAYCKATQCCQGNPPCEELEG